jgi:hypothetical protein
VPAFVRSIKEGTGTKSVSCEAPAKVSCGAPRPRRNPQDGGKHSQSPARKELCGQGGGAGAPRKEPMKFCSEHQDRGMENKVLCRAPRPRKKPQDGGKQQPRTKKKWSEGRRNVLAKAR